MALFVIERNFAEQLALTNDGLYEAPNAEARLDNSQVMRNLSALSFCANGGCHAIKSSNCALTTGTHTGRAGVDRRHAGTARQAAYALLSCTKTLWRLKASVYQ
jgi:hypothetical protein